MNAVWLWEEAGGRFSSLKTSLPRRRNVGEILHHSSARWVTDSIASVPTLDPGLRVVAVPFTNSTYFSSWPRRLCARFSTSAAPLNTLVSTTPAEMKTKLRNIPGLLYDGEEDVHPRPLYPETMMTAVEACRRTIGSCAAGPSPGEARGAGRPGAACSPGRSCMAPDGKACRDEQAGDEKRHPSAAANLK